MTAHKLLPLKTHVFYYVRDPTELFWAAVPFSSSKSTYTFHSFQVITWNVLSALISIGVGVLPSNHSRCRPSMFCRCGNNCFSCHWPLKASDKPYLVMAFLAHLIPFLSHVSLPLRITLAARRRQRFLPGLGNFPDSTLVLSMLGFPNARPFTHPKCSPSLFIFWIMKLSADWHKCVAFGGKNTALN